MEQLVDGFINELLDRWLDSWSSFPYDCTVQWEMDHILLFLNVYFVCYLPIGYETDLLMF